MVRDPAYRNGLLASLGAADLALLRESLQPATLTIRQRLEIAGRPIRHVYFIEEGLASIMTVSALRQRQVEIAVLGSEGMTGQAVVLGVDRSSTETFMLVAGRGFSISADRLRALMAASPALAQCFLSYVHVLGMQTAHTALANATGSIEARLARWLLMARDRLGRDDMQSTHAFIAVLLGVRRPGITIAFQRLEARGAISTSRGETTIIDRGILEALADGLYGEPEAEYRRVFQRTPGVVEIVPTK